ncbi:MAG TPA: hypothetical protein VGU46_02275 [Acidobacteriaceae bacterium]|nr:hypothetical protein [Acidobacteriaceae bacterium]
MKSLTSGLLAAFLLCATAIAQESQKAAPSAPRSHTLTTNGLVLPNGIRIEMRTMAEGITGTSWLPKFMGGPQSYGVYTGFIDGNVYHHFFYIGERYFGYDLDAEPVGGTRQIRLTFQPLSMDWAGEGEKVPAALPALPPEQVIREGEELVMDLAVDPASGEKITEHMSFQVGTPRPSWQPPDLTLDDVGMHLSSPALFEDGQLIGRYNDAASAPVFAMHLHDGRWLYLSFKPHDGYDFKRAGVIHAARAEFAIGGHEFEVRSRSLIAQRPEISLYVLLDRREPADRGNVLSIWAPNTEGSKNYVELRAGTVEEMLPKP